MLEAAFTIARLIGVKGCIIVAMLVFYEGVPVANYVTPVLRVIPYVGPLTDDIAQGRVGRAYERGEHDAAAIWRRNAEHTQKTLQDKYDAIHAKYDEAIAGQQDLAIELSALHQAVDQAKRDDGACAGKPVVPAGVSERLDAIGRSSPGAHQ